MIQSIVSVFEEQARQHKIIRSFHYHRQYALGNGNEMHPLLWLEDPITGCNRNNTFVNSANFSVLFVPKKETQISELQNTAFSIGLNMLERIRQNVDSPIGILPDWTYITLRDYYDNNACGCRFSVDFTHRNTHNRCLTEAPFDNNKTLSTAIDLKASAILPKFDLPEV
jgi:hypothetical protein